MLFYILVSLVALVLSAVFIAILFRIVVATNEVHVVQRRKNAIPYGRGQAAGNVYYNLPSWIPFFGITRTVLPVSNFTIILDEYDAYDVDKVPFSVDIQAFFRVDAPAMAAERVENFDELKEQLDGILKGAIRSILAKHPVVKIMEERSAFGKQFTNEVDEQLKEWGVVSVKSIELMDIRDTGESRVITNIMRKKESAIEKESRTEVAQNMRDAEIAEIEARREQDVKEQEAEKIVGEKTADKDRAVGIAKEKAQQEIKTEAKITKEKDMEVKRVEDVKTAEIAKDVQVVKSEEEKQKAIIEAEGKRQETETIAEGQKLAEIKRSEGILAVGTKEAEVSAQKEKAQVAGQIELAEKIAELAEYMQYLVAVESIKAGRDVGEAQAVALEKADLKLISTGSGKDGSGEIKNLLDMLSPKGGANLGAMIDTFKQTAEGSKLADLFKGKSEEKESKKEGKKSGDNKKSTTTIDSVKKSK